MVGRIDGKTGIPAGRLLQWSSFRWQRYIWSLVRSRYVLKVQLVYMIWDWTQVVKKEAESR